MCWGLNPGHILGSFRKGSEMEVTNQTSLVPPLCPSPLRHETVSFLSVTPLQSPAIDQRPPLSLSYSSNPGRENTDSGCTALVWSAFPPFAIAWPGWKMLRELV